MQIHLVIFDCDGVLIDSEIISARTLREEAAANDIDIPVQHILRQYVGRSFPTVISQIESQFQVNLPPAFERNYRTRLLSAFENELEIIAGVKDVIRRLNRPFCVATSSSPKRVARSLELVGLTSFFGENIFTASQVEHPKPAPDLFLYAAKTMGASPANCLVIEDSVLGVQAGLSAGMNVLRFTGGAHIENKLDSAAANGVFDKFENFFNIYPELET